MAVDKKISQLASGAPAQAGDEYVVARSGANYKLTLTNIAASMPPIGATTPNTGSFTSLTNSGNLTFSSTGQRITGDMSNATLSNRLFFQNSVTNANTDVAAIPNGTGTAANFTAFGSSSDQANTTLMRMGVDATTTFINSFRTGTGSFLPLVFSTGGSERMRLTTTGELGLGVAAPTIPLQIGKGGGGNPATSGTTQTYGIARIGSGGAAALDVGTYAAGQVWMQGVNVTNLASNFNLVLQPNGGNVGIGTASPGYKLEVSGGDVRTNTTNFLYANTLRLRGSDTYQIYESAASTNLAIATASGAVVISPNLTERMRIDSSGNVGIGTASPNYKISVNGTGNFYNGVSGLGRIFLGDPADPSGYIGIYRSVLGPSNSATAGNGLNFASFDGYTFNTGATVFGSQTERMRITSDGELLIGTTARINATASPLQAYATTGSGIVVQMTQSGSDTISVWNSATTGDNDFIDFYTEGAATLRGNITYNRGAGQVAYNITSDVRLKENIADAVDAGDKIDAMQVRQFDWKETGNHLDYGFVAQELHNVAPHAVSKPTNDDEMWSVDYSKLVPILVKELQAVRARLAALEAK